MLLYGKDAALLLQTTAQSKVKKYFWQGKKYVAILFFWENSSSKTYVKHKQKYGQDIWLATFVFWQGQLQNFWEHFSYLQIWNEKDYNEVEDILNLIDFLNQDEHCVGIMIQLPLPNHLAQFKNQLLQVIREDKDIDWLSGWLAGKSFFEMLDFTPATPKAVLKLLDYYQLWDLKGKKVVILWQSTIVGKPLALECLKRWAQLQCFDIKNTPEEIQQWCQNAEIVFSGTGTIHLINNHHVNKEKNQIFIDIGYGHLDGKAVGDVDFEAVKDKVLHITPVPGGVWPLTIACLFDNVFDLWEHFHL